MFIVQRCHTGSLNIRNQKKFNKMKSIVLTLFVSIAILFFVTGSAIAQEPGAPPPPPANPSGGGNGPVGGGAPVGGGLLILIALGAAYGGKKVYDYKKKKLAE
jgi:hypothetical protein